MQHMQTECSGIRAPRGFTRRCLIGPYHAGPRSFFERLDGIVLRKKNILRLGTFIGSLLCFLSSTRRIGCLDCHPCKAASRKAASRKAASRKLKQGSAWRPWWRQSLDGGGKPCPQRTHPLQCFLNLVLQEEASASQLTQRNGAQSACSC